MGRPHPPSRTIIACPAGRRALLASVTATLADTGTNIAESAQFWDRSTNRFFMRIAFQAPAEVTSDAIRAAMARWSRSSAWRRCW